MFKWLGGERAKRLLREVNEVLIQDGAVATDVTPHTVGSQGDDRVYGPGLMVTFRSGTTTTEAGEITTKLINRQHKGHHLTRVFMEIARREES